MALLHGGQLSRVAKQYQIPEQNWLDLSTGIAPFSYPIPDIPLHIWQNLPSINSELIDAAKAYYQAQYCWPLAGSQQLIEKLPTLWAQQVTFEHTGCQHVYLPKVGYKEHEKAWRDAAFQIHHYQTQLPSSIEKNSVVVVINPNNPLADCFSTTQLKALLEDCIEQSALLVIDEAFIDCFACTDSFVSTLNQQTYPDILVLRSIGKFFGLAGLRIGFVCASEAWCERIKEEIGPWSINAPALYITQLALRDSIWQKQQQQRLFEQSKSMQQLLMKHFPNHNIAVNPLFITVFTNKAERVYRVLCEQAIYVRLTNEKHALRFGIANPKQLQELCTRLENIKLL